MTDTNAPLTKTCASCGIEKSLSAFLVLSGGAAAYGSFCADCRRSGKDKKQQKDPSEEGTTSNTGHKIDTKARIAGEIDKRTEREIKEETYFEEREETELLEKESNEEEDTTLKKEKEHHRSYLDNAPFLKTRSTDQTRRAPTHFETQEIAREKNEKSKAGTDAYFVAEENKLKEENTRVNTSEDLRKTQIDFTAPFEDTRVAGKIKYQGEMHKRFATWVGTNSPIGRSLAQESGVTTKQETSAKEFVEKNWRPGTKR